MAKVFINLSLSIPRETLDASPDIPRHHAPEVARVLVEIRANTESAWPGVRGIATQIMSVLSSSSRFLDLVQVANSYPGVSSRTARLTYDHDIRTMMYRAEVCFELTLWQSVDPTQKTAIPATAPAELPVPTAPRRLTFRGMKSISTGSR